MIERRPLWPPWLPPSRNRSLPKGSAKSSVTTSRSCERRVLAGQELADGEPGIVHVGQRLDQREVEAAVAALDDVRGIALAARAGPAGPLGEAIEDEPADVVARAGIRRTRVPETDDELQPTPPRTSRRRTTRQGPNPVRPSRGSGVGGRAARGWYRGQGIGHPEQPALEGAHRGLLVRLGVVEAADMERAVRDEEAELFGGGPADIAGVAAAAGLGLLAGALDRDHEVAKVRAGDRAAAADRRGGRPLAAGPERLGREQRERQHVRRAGLAHVGAFSPASSASSERISPIDAGAGAPAASRAAVMARTSAAIATGAWTPSRTVTSTRHGGR